MVMKEGVKSVLFTLQRLIMLRFMRIMKKIYVNH